jgi:predicted DNA repair protein MutK
MATGFFALLDDIAMLMDDVSAASKVAAKNTAGVLGDDLAVNASKASTFSSSRELPVIWAITKGSLVNKVIIVPLMLLLSYYFPEAITPILILGGLFLSYEGAHGIWGYLFPHEKNENQEPMSEKAKIKSAIITDFILSIEIVLISLASVKELDTTTQIAVVSLIAVAATVGVYGFVTLLVRLDDMGFAIANDCKVGSLRHRFGMFLVRSLPYIIKILSVVGVFAMLLVAGGIFVHNIHQLHDIIALNHIPTLMGELIIALLT